ncbi:MAG TPA: DUF4398 domain-containing protein [Nitrospira sp.]|nr:DUF4398 domain-containing protein [Nitrospira sp.]
MRTVIGPTLIIVISFSGIGCASSGPPVTPVQLADTEATIRSAESAGAFERAPDLLQKARQALSVAQQASGKGDHRVARERLLEATTQAEAARARAQAEQKKSEASMVHQQADELEAKVKLLQKQLQAP